MQGQILLPRQLWNHTYQLNNIINDFSITGLKHQGRQLINKKIHEKKVGKQRGAKVGEL
jgi:hypothetical protein